jgi:hypothetical protein
MYVETVKTEVIVFYQQTDYRSDAENYQYQQIDYRSDAENYQSV